MNIEKAKRIQKYAEIVRYLLLAIFVLIVVASLML